MVVAVGFRNSIDWALDKVTGFVGGVATASSWLQLLRRTGRYLIPLTKSERIRRCSPDASTSG